jgi:uncharacterized protein YdaU (DUF1376 family)
LQIVGDGDADQSAEVECAIALMMKAIEGVTACLLSFWNPNDSTWVEATINEELTRHSTR